MVYEALNIKQALEQLGGSEKLYGSVVKGFYSQYEHVDDTIEAFLAMGDFHAAERTAHSIKGLSGNLGAFELRKRALDLELSIKNNRDHVSEFMTAFSEELANVVKELEVLIEANYNEKKTDSRYSGKNENGFGKVLKTMIDALNTHRYMDIQDSLSQIRQTSVPRHHKPDVAKAVAYIEAYEYDLANETLRKLLEY